jgi:hypothetical protein
MNTAMTLDGNLTVMMNWAMVQSESREMQCGIQSDLIKKTDILNYYREVKMAFLNLGSLLISLTDGRLYIFNVAEDLVFIDQIQI